MTLIRAIAVALLACTGLLVPALANAQARGPSRLAPGNMDVERPVVTTVTRDEKFAELATWLQRLVGRYRIDGSVDQPMNVSRVVGEFARAHRSVRGAADCRGIGKGAGVECVINVEWERIIWERSGGKPATSEFFTMRPAVLLFGIDPDASGIHVLQVDQNSIALGAMGLLSDNTLELRTTCGTYPSPKCHRDVRITAEPGGDVVAMDIHAHGSIISRFEFKLHREPAQR